MYLHRLVPAQALFTIVLGSLTLASCSPKVVANLSVRKAPLPAEAKVLVLDIDEYHPEANHLVGRVSVTDKGASTGCKWDKVIAIASEQARSMGGNVVKIERHLSPGTHSSCDQISARVYHYPEEELESLKTRQNPLEDSTWTYAKIVYYRPGNEGFLVGYDLHVGQENIEKVRTGTRGQARISSKGLNTIWAETEKRIEVPVNLEYGRTYYVRCSMGPGIIIGRPVLERTDRELGAKDIESPERWRKF